jgi:hypothetical protein
VSFARFRREGGAVTGRHGRLRRLRAWQAGEVCVEHDVLTYATQQPCVCRKCHHTLRIPLPTAYHLHPLELLLRLCTVTLARERLRDWRMVAGIFR